ncbi:MAG: hypothetical protein WAX77_09655 [Methylococcaceae bacterium]
MNTLLIDEYQFHDNFVHGIYFDINPGGIKSELHLDIDHIIQWSSCSENEVFIISKAILKFYDVTDLSINIEWDKTGYTSSVSGSCIIDCIKSEKIKTSLRFPAYYKCEILTHDESSKISFGASGMCVEIKGKPVKVINRQYLMENERNNS